MRLRSSTALVTWWTSTRLTFASAVRYTLAQCGLAIRQGHMTTRLGSPCSGTSSSVASERRCRSCGYSVKS
eukprot:1102423-Amphidinium_carterae.1